MSDFLSIKNWTLEDRPREKMMHRGANALTNAELLAILINTGTKQKSALDIAKELLDISDNSILEIGKLSFSELKRIKGIGEKKAITLQAALELGKRRQTSEAKAKNKITSSKDAFDILQPFFIDFVHEAFVVLFLNNSNQVQALETISEGGMTATLVDVRILFSKALQYKGVTKILLSHNHPSGNLKPSDADIKLTRKVADAGKLLDITVVDHVIVTQTQYYSFADEGLL